MIEAWNESNAKLRGKQPRIEERIEKIEAVISNLVRNSEDLSDIVAAQDKEISRIKDSLQWLLERDFERQNAENTVTDEKLPPHW